jgi:hypothetical protein
MIQSFTQEEDLKDEEKADVRSMSVVICRLYTDVYMKGCLWFYAWRYFT